jgi:tripartite ATP-independent transporter DctM subunit
VTALLVILSGIVLIMLRVPVAYALLAPSLCYLLLASRVPLVVAVQQMVSSVNGYTLLAVPLFLLVGSLAHGAGIGDRIFDAMQNLVGRFRAGLGYVNVLASLGFSWMSGSAVSDAAVMGRVVVPQMQKRGYSDRFVAGITAGSAIIAPTMPPSIPAVLFGVVSGVSIGSLFAAAVLPALALSAMLFLAVWLYGRGRDDLRVPPPTSSQLVKSVLGMLPAMGAPVIVLGGILGGLFTPTEAAGAAAAYLVLIGTFWYRTLDLQGLTAAFLDCARSLAPIMILLACSMVFGWVMTVEHVPSLLANLVGGWTSSAIVFMLMSILVLLVIGFLLEPGAAIMIVTPVLMPVAATFGVPPIQYGFLVIFVLLIGLYTPPVGMVLFVMQSITKIPSREIFLGVLPFILIFLLLALFVVLVPGLTLWLPSIIIR